MKAIKNKGYIGFGFWMKCRMTQTEQVPCLTVALAIQENQKSESARLNYNCIHLGDFPQPSC